MFEVRRVSQTHRERHTYTVAQRVTRSATLFCTLAAIFLLSFRLHGLGNVIPSWVQNPLSTVPSLPFPVVYNSILFPTTRVSTTYIHGISRPAFFCRYACSVF